MPAEPPVTLPAVPPLPPAPLPALPPVVPLLAPQSPKQNASSLHPETNIDSVAVVIHDAAILEEKRVIRERLIATPPWCCGVVAR
jgi:hypothetical protein